MHKRYIYTASRWILKIIPLEFYDNFAEGVGGSIFCIYSNIILFGSNVEFDGNFAAIICIFMQFSKC